MYASKALEIQGSPGSESPGLSAVVWRLSTVALLKTAIFSWISNAFETYISAHIGIASNFNTRGKYVVPPYSISFKKYVFTSGSQCVSLSWTLESAQPMSVRMSVIPMGWPAGVVNCGRASRACLPIRLAASSARNCSPIGNGILELTVEPEAANLPVPAETLDELLHHVLWALRVGVEVLLQDPRIL